MFNQLRLQTRIKLLIILIVYWTFSSHSESKLLSGRVAMQYDAKLKVATRRYEKAGAQKYCSFSLNFAGTFC